jgi:hypothetical protein
MDNFESPQNPANHNLENPVENKDIPLQENTFNQNQQDVASSQSNLFDQNSSTQQPQYQAPVNPQYPPNQPQYQQMYNQPPFQQAYPQNSYQQFGGYKQPVNPPYAVQRKPEPGISVASLVVSLVALVLCWVPFLNFLLALVGLILGIVAKVKGGGGMAIAGIVIGAISLFISIIIVLLIIPAIIYGIKYAEEYKYYGSDFFDWSITFSSIIRK